MEVAQINLNHCEEAQALLSQVMVEEIGDIAIVSEPYSAPTGSSSWVADKTGNAAIWVTGRYPIQRVVSNTFEGFCIAEVNGVFFCSCYAPPSWELERFHVMLDNLVAELDGHRPLVIAGDFNALAVEWGSKQTNSRGDAVLESFARLGVTLGNTGTTPTFNRNERTSIVDITFCSPTLSERLNWRVSDALTLSDHNVVRYAIIQGHRLTSSSAHGSRVGGRGWKTESFNEDFFKELLAFGDFGEAVSASQIVIALTKACDGAMPRRKPPNGRRPPVYWWNASIKRQRAECVAARRKMQRKRCPEVKQQLRIVYIAARSELKRAIKASKRQHFLKLCDEIARKPWGLAFNTLMNKVKSSEPVEQCPVKLKSIIETLFPTHAPPNLSPTINTPETDPVPITTGDY
uniref:uncharacterized protein LOC125907478 n=1 Tax=Anopheles coluzzii TaxID=1518534 RepID=UPI0020FFC043|nr:uncharacterized protein LOC125907478 [Anopheles coluzzii]